MIGNVSMFLSELVDSMTLQMLWGLCKHYPAPNVERVGCGLSTTRHPSFVRSFCSSILANLPSHQVPADHMSGYATIVDMATAFNSKG